MAPRGVGVRWARGVPVAGRGPWEGCVRARRLPTGGYRPVDVLPLAGEVRRDGSEDGQAASEAPEGKLEAEEAGGGSGFEHADPQGGHPSKLTCPERHRRTVESVRRILGHEKVSERSVRRVLGQNRGTQRNRPRKLDGDLELLGLMRKIVETFPRHGSKRTHRVLTDANALGGWKVNFKQVHRIFKEEHVPVPQKRRKRQR